MGAGSAFNGYGYLRPCSDTCFYGDEKNGSFEDRHNLFLTITKTVS